VASGARSLSSICRTTGVGRNIQVARGVIFGLLGKSEFVRSSLKPGHAIAYQQRRMKRQHLEVAGADGIGASVRTLQHSMPRCGSGH
jgi:hypothetical protein